MFTLIINKPGLFIEIPGLSPFRTPATIKIKPNQMNIIINELHKNDIQDYQIIPYKEDPIKKIDKVKTPPVDPLNDRLNKIESLLEKILEKDPVVIERSISVKSKKKNKEDKIDDFIPNIDITNLKLSDKKASIEHKETLNTDETAKLLRLMKGKKK